MASLIWLNLSDQEAFKTSDYTESFNISPNKPYRTACGDRAIIAKGNVIEGIKAEY